MSKIKKIYDIESTEMLWIHLKNRWIVKVAEDWEGLQTTAFPLPYSRTLIPCVINLNSRKKWKVILTT